MNAVHEFAQRGPDNLRLVPSAVKKWLQANGILYFLDADGRPCTTVKALDDALNRGRTTRPNWDAVFKR